MFPYIQTAFALGCRWAVHILLELEFQIIEWGPPHVESLTLFSRIVYDDFKRADQNKNRRDGAGDRQKIN